MDQLLTIPQCLDLPETTRLKRQPSHFTIIRAINAGILPSIKPGRDHLIRKSDYLEWLTGYPHKRGPKPR